MTTPVLDDYVAELERTARSASVMEEDLRREFARRFELLESERQFAFRRYSLMRAVTQAVAGAANEEEAIGKGNAAFMAEIGWAGATELQRTVTQQFGPVLLAVWNAAHPTEEVASDIAPVQAALADFERWFSENNDVSFLTLLEQPLEYYPIVEG